MDLRCPKCNSTDLKKVSLVYQEGLYRTDSRARLSAVLIGVNGPDLVVGQATTRGTEQSALSKKLSPPVKWLYLKVIFWSVLLFLCCGWLVFYVYAVTTNASTVLSPPVTRFALIFVAAFVVILFLLRRHNHSNYAQRRAQWDRSLICKHCGAVTVLWAGSAAPEKVSSSSFHG
jgi:hypothetical protein